MANKIKDIGVYINLKKKNRFIIDLIATSKNFRKRCCHFTDKFYHNQIMRKKDKITAGTQINNLAAVKMYQNLGFIRKKKERHFVITHSW